MFQDDVESDQRLALIKPCLTEGLPVPLQKHFAHLYKGCSGAVEKHPPCSQLSPLPTYTQDAGAVCMPYMSICTIMPGLLETHFPNTVPLLHFALGFLGLF